MANSIALFSKYVALLDDVYKAASKTSVLDGDTKLVTLNADTNEMIVPVIKMDGLGNYDRTNGYPKGSVTLTKETKKPDYDRGRTFSVDREDNAETAGQAFGRLSAEFIRTKVVPETDANRFAKYAAAAGNSASGALADGSAVISAISGAGTVMDDAEVPSDQRFLFITSKLYNLIRDMDTTKSREALKDYDGRMIIVPQPRFYSAIDLLDGTSAGETDGGYKKDTAGKDINFMIVHKPAILQFTKNITNKAISPDDNQDTDAWKFFYRIYELNEVYDEKKAGIYVHTAAA